MATDRSRAKDFCDLCQNVPRHRNSDHLMSFKREFLTLSIAVICAGHVPARKPFLSLIFSCLSLSRGFEKGLADRGAWRKDIHPIP